MAYYNPDCMGNYDFDNIADFAKKRFIDGYSTIELLLQAKTVREKEEIALVAMMDLDDATVEKLELSCQYAKQCQVTNCRTVIKQIIENNLTPLAT
ncbi:MAG: hypothetical protein OEY36_03540 [Gammaproteobacteria bacterium]|nr:hypothetical protein [Gammaproteobacteria bacterium]